MRSAQWLGGSLGASSVGASCMSSTYDCTWCGLASKIAHWARVLYMLWCHSSKRFSREGLPQMMLEGFKSMPFRNDNLSHHLRKQGAACFIVLSSSRGHHRILKIGLLRELSPGPLAPEARIMPLGQAAGAELVGTFSHAHRHTSLVCFFVHGSIRAGPFRIIQSSSSGCPFPMPAGSLHGAIMSMHDVL